MMPIGENERCYVLENKNNNKLVLVRGANYPNYPFTGEDALCLGCECNEISKEEDIDDWEVKEINNDELNAVSDEISKRREHSDKLGENRM